MHSTRLPASFSESLYSCRTTSGFLSSSNANISLYCLQYATAKEEHTKSDKRKSDCFIWTDDEVELLLKVCIKYKTSKTNENWYRLGVLARDLSPTRTAQTFWLAAMLFCSHAVETTVETGPDLATSSNSKVSGFDRPHVSEKISDSKVSTLESGFKSFRIR